MPVYFLQRLSENLMVLPEFYLLLCPKIIVISKILGDPIYNSASYNAVEWKSTLLGVMIRDHFVWSGNPLSK